MCRDRVRVIQRVILVLVVILVALPGLVQAGKSGDCLCKPYDDSSGQYGTEQFLDYVESADQCNGVYQRDLNEVQYVNYLGDRSGRYKNCRAYTEADGNKAYACLDTKAECRWEAKVDYCCCKQAPEGGTAPGGNITECVQATNYTPYQFCNAQVFGAGNEKVPFWEQGVCECGASLQKFPTVVLDSKYFINNNRGPQYVLQEVPERIATCIDRSKDTEQSANCHFNNKEKCICSVLQKGPNRTVQLSLNEYACKKAKCAWKPTYLSSETGYRLFPADNKQCTTYLQQAKDKVFTPSVDQLKREAADLNQLKRFSTPAQFIGQGVKALVGFMGSIALVFYIFGGIMWMTAGGNSERVEQAKKIFLWTTLGVAVMLGSYLILGKVLDFILGQ